jgi:hypothetical protein
MPRHSPPSRRFTRESIIESIKTALWVVPITLLIWFYAEREQNTKEFNFPCVIKVRCSDPNLIATIIYPPDQMVTATLSGPQARLDTVKSLLTGGSSPSPVEIVIPSQTPGTVDLPAAASMSSQRVFHDNLVTVESCVPPSLRIQVDRVEERDAKVVVPISATNLEGPASFDPPYVRVRGPQNAVNSITRKDAKGNPLVAADFSKFSDMLALPGEHDLRGVPLELPSANPNVKLDPATVTAHVTVRRADVSATLDAVPIFPYAPRSVEDEYKIEFVGGDTLPNIHVSGPPDEIALLTSGKKKPTAMLAYSREDIPTAGGRRAPQFLGLPDHVTVDPADASREIEFKLTKRSATE